MSTVPARPPSPRDRNQRAPNEGDDIAAVVRIAQWKRRRSAALALSNGDRTHPSYGLRSVPGPVRPMATDRPAGDPETVRPTPLDEDARARYRARRALLEALRIPPPT